MSISVETVHPVTDRLVDLYWRGRSLAETARCAGRGRSRRRRR
jgi:hypothetical protein